MRVVTHCLSLAVIASAQAQQKPNFILILTDDQGFDDYGFRQPPLETPTMDKLMREGVQFSRMYTAAACAPTRSQVMTGRNFMRTGTAGVGYGADAPHLGEYLLSEAMSDANYATGMVGKWNLGTSDADMPSRRGFDETWQVAAEHVRGYGRYTHLNAPFFHNGTYSGIEYGWQVEQVTNKATDFIERHKHEPFFLYLPYSSPHEPWLCRKELQEKYMKMGIGESYAMFLGMMEQLDTQVGQILEVLQSHGIDENTIILFLGDNGPTPKTRLLRENDDGGYSLTGEQYTLNDTEWASRNPSNLRSKKASAWENGIRNRLSIYCATKFSPKEVSEMVLSMDIYPTLLDLAGEDRKEDAPPLDGASLKPFLLEDNPTWPKNRGYLTGETGAPQSFLRKDGWHYRFTKKHSLPLDQRSTCFIYGNWVIVNDKTEWGLFNLKWDPEQKYDRKTARPERFAKMQKQYYTKLRNVRKDKHAWSIPVQHIGIPGVNQPYLEMVYTFRMQGKNSVTWYNTFFRELGATQELKVRVRKAATYKTSLRALKVPKGTKVRLYTPYSEIIATLNSREKFHDLGQIDFERGGQNLGLTVLECNDPDALPKMEVFSLNLTKVE